jgi:hypothetical protein
MLEAEQSLLLTELDRRYQTLRAIHADAEWLNPNDQYRDVLKALEETGRDIFALKDLRMTLKKAQEHTL